MSDTLPVLLVTGPIGGAVAVQGATYNLTPAVIEVAPEHLDELHHHIELMHEVNPDSPLGPDYRHDAVACGHCPDTAPEA